MANCSRFVAPMHKRYEVSNLADDLANLLTADSEDFKVLAEAANLNSDNGDLEQIDLSRIDLSGQDLSGLNLVHADFYATQLKDADLRSTKLTALNLVEARDIEEAKMDDSIRQSFEDARRNFYLTIPIAEFEFSVRTTNVLRSIGFQSLCEVAQFKASELLRLPQLGMRTLEEVQNVLASIGVILVPENAQSNAESIERVLEKAALANVDLKGRLKQQLSKRIAEVTKDGSRARFRVSNLRSVRESNDMTRVEFVRRSNVSEKTIMKIENSPTESVVLLSTFLRICSALGASADELKFEVLQVNP